MYICRLATLLSVLFATAALDIESHSSGRRLRIRSGAAQQQSPLAPLLAAAQNSRSPVVHFLFLAVNKVNNIDVWKSFFAKAPADKYKAYVHCKTQECINSVAGSPLQPIRQVPSFYCADLVTPMNALINEALISGGTGRNPADKFVFVSDSTLPAKPFSFIYDTLSARSGSDFCVCSMKEWATRREAPLPGAAQGRALEMAVKTHQWLVLDRGHAEHIAQIWITGPVLIHDFLTRFQMNLPPKSRAVKTFAGSSDSGCLDEFYHMAALYGTMPYADRNDTLVNLPGFTNTPLHVSTATELQGSCDTFVAWPEYAKARDMPLNKTERNSFRKLYAALDPLSVPYSGDASKPGYWDAISTHGLKAIRASDFLFVRKFADGPRVVDGGNFNAVYSKFVFQ